MATNRWVIAYDIHSKLAKEGHINGGVAYRTVYNKVIRCLNDNGFSFIQESVYAMPDEDGALIKVYDALRSLEKLEEKKYIKRLHVFKIDGALNDALPTVLGGQKSAGQDDEPIGVYPKKRTTRSNVRKQSASLALLNNGETPIDATLALNATS